MVSVVDWALGGVGDVHLFEVVVMVILGVVIVGVGVLVASDSDFVDVAVQKPSLPHVAIDSQHSSPQQVSASRQAPPPGQHISVSGS